jgi:hypothetical protein
VAAGPLSSHAARHGADQVVAGLRPAFRTCYQRGLSVDAEMSGRTVLVAQLASDGTVVRAWAVETYGLSAPVVECMTGVVQGARFPAPSDPDHEIRIPLTFVAK